MITLDHNNKEVLNIFENFEIDKNLPKHKKIKTRPNTDSSEGEFDGEESVMWSSDNFGPVSSNKNNITEKPSHFKSFLKSISKIFDKSEKIKNFENIENESLQVQLFFENIHNKYKELNLNEDALAFYKNHMDNAIKNGQVALLEKLKKQSNVYINETKMIDKNVMFLEEEDVVNFYNKYGHLRKLNLTWIANYSRIIPQNVTNTKQSFDELKIFDNYVVLHYELKEAIELTEKQKRRLKDPILFGVIDGSRKLYFIDEWKDEYCDLSLNDVLNVLQKDSIKISSEIVKNNIS